MEMIRTGGFSFRSTLVACVLLLVFSFALGSVAQAQSTAILNGTVTDATGAAVPNAKVAAKNIATGVESTTQSDSAGAYLFPALSIGVYRLQVSATGFQTAVLADLKLQVATTSTRDIQLQIGQVSQSIEITGEAALVETATTGVGQVIDEKTVQEIPLNGRHFTDLSLLTPGTVTPPQNGFLSAPLRGQGSFGINTAGQREDTTNWLVNGINLNDPVQNQITFQPPIDTLAEYKIDNSTFPAQYGRSAGAIVNLATRSGTNEYHGEAFEFFRNNALDARNFFNTVALGPQAPFNRNEFGADFGGPIKKNKAFFFLAYEGLRQHQKITVSTTVPSIQQIATIPASATAVKSLLKLIPAANSTNPGDVATDPTTFTGFTGGVVANVNLNQGSADLDLELTGKDRIHGYYVVQKDLRQEPTSGTNIPGFGDTRDGFRQLMTVSEDHIFGPALTNTVRLGFNRIHLFFTPTALDPAAFNIKLPAGGPGAVGLPNIVVNGAVAFGGPTNEPQGRGDTTVVLNDTLSWLKGRHTFAFGGEIRRAYNNNVAENIGSFTFNPTVAGGVVIATAMTNFLNDKAANFTLTLGAGNDRLLQPSYAGFAQDTFKWKPNFTFNLGLRYEWNSTPSEAINRFTNFDLATGTLIPANQPYQTNNKNFEPRVGFAWDPFKNGKSSIRAAYAILAQNPNLNIVTGLSGNPPFALPLNISAAAITLENPSAAIVGVGLGPSSINPNFKNMYAQDWNLTIERQLTSTMGLSVAYVGTKGTHVQLNQNVNQPLVTNGVYGAVRPFRTLPLTSSVLPAQCAPPNPPCTLGAINQVNGAGTSNYNALWVTLNKHFSHGFEFLASYTFSKSLDFNSLSSNESIPLQNAYNPRGDYGLSEFDVRHRFVMNGVYQLPFKGNRLISGWQVGVITQAQSGNPLTPLIAVNVGGGITQTLRPDITGPIQTTGDPAQWYVNKAVFVSPCVAGVCHPGNLGRDAITGPDFVNTDFNVTKNTKLTERLNLQFRTEMFDIFNHPNFGNPLTTVGAATFGTVKPNGTRFPGGDFGSARQLQFALKMQF